MPCVAEHDPAEAERLFSFEALERAYRECRRRKRGTRNALRFEESLERNLIELSRDLSTGRYRPLRSVCFITTRPKCREIVAADFRDRIVHHVLVRALEPVWEPAFIHASYASRKGKGTHAAVDRLAERVRKVTANHTRRAWYAHLDIRSFFTSIDHDVLLETLARRSPSPTLQWLAARIVRHDIAAGAIRRGPRRSFERVPEGKSLLRAPPGKGLPIGNHTSQFFANVYLNGLDHFVKRTLRARYYLRYVDDLVLLSEEREELLEWKRRIERFLADRLRLELNERRTRIAPVSSGIDFLGYVVHPRHRLVRRRVVQGLVSRLRALEPRLTERWGGYRWVRYRPRTSEYLRAVEASYGAHFRRADARGLEAAIDRRFPWVAEALQWPDGKPFWTGRRLFPCLGAQAHRLDRRFSDSLLAIEVGRFLEFYGRRAEQVAALARLKLYRGRRAGYRGWTRVPVTGLPYLVEAARRAGVPRIVLVLETDRGESAAIEGPVFQRAAVLSGTLDPARA